MNSVEERLARYRGELDGYQVGDSEVAVQTTGPSQGGGQRVLALAFVTVFVVVGLVALARRGATDVPAGGQGGPEAAPSIFDGGVDMIVFFQHGSVEHQAEPVRQELLQHGDLLDISRIEYLDADQSLALARRVFSNDPATLAQVEPRIPTMFLLYANPGVSQGELAALGQQLMLLPLVIDVRVSDPPNGSGLSVNCDPSPCALEPTDGDHLAPTPTMEASP